MEHGVEAGSGAFFHAIHLADEFEEPGFGCARPDRPTISIRRGIAGDAFGPA